MNGVNSNKATQFSVRGKVRDRVPSRGQRGPEGGVAVGDSVSISGEAGGIEASRGTGVNFDVWNEEVRSKGFGSPNFGSKIPEPSLREKIGSMHLYHPW